MSQATLASQLPFGGEVDCYTTPAPENKPFENLVSIAFRL